MYTQAVNYVPNQFDRGESVVCVVALRVREGCALRVVVCDDRRMADTAIVSADKANIVRQHVRSTVASDLSSAPLLHALGREGLALCLVDSDDYELAVPHVLFSEELLEAETVLEIGERHSVIGRVVGAPGVAATCVETVLKTMSKGDLSDAARLGKALSLSFNDNGLPSSADWFSQNASPV